MYRERDERAERDPSEDMVRLRESAEELVGAVSGRVWRDLSSLLPLAVPAPASMAALDVEEWPPKSRSHRRSCKPVRIGSFPFDLSESENDLPGDLRGDKPDACLGISAFVFGGVLARGPGKREVVGGGR